MNMTKVKLVKHMVYRDPAIFFFNEPDEFKSCTTWEMDQYLLGSGYLSGGWEVFWIYLKYLENLVVLRLFEMRSLTWVYSFNMFCYVKGAADVRAVHNQWASLTGITEENKWLNCIKYCWR